VKPEPGSRDGLASRARRDDVDDDVDGDGDEDGERDEAPDLRAMRSVWLAMRDEDPPAGGLTELLAAARAKAETMQARPTLYQRLTAGLRRPPALALATVLVLVGGAVLLGRRSVDAPVRVRVTDPSGIVARAPVAPAAAPAGRPDGVNGSFAQPPIAPATVPADERSATGAGSGGNAVPPEPGAKLEAAGKSSVTPGSAMGEPAAEAPAGDHRAADAAPVVIAVEGSGGVTRNTEAPPVSAGHVALRREPTLKAPSRGPPPSEAAPEGGALTSGDLAGTARGRNARSPAEDPGEVAKQAGKKATKEAKDDEATNAEHDKQAASPAGSIEQLYEQCESAARRGDCAAVRRLIARITTRDRGYRARVAKDSAIGKCLPDPAE